MRRIRVKLLTKTAKIPEKKYEQAAAYDICTDESGLVPPGASRCVGSGIAMDISPYGGILTHRSGAHTEDGILISGLVDPDYRGEIKITINNLGYEEFRYKRGDRIAQLRLVEIPDTTLEVVDGLGETVRNTKGHGSSGR